MGINCGAALITSLLALTACGGESSDSGNDEAGGSNAGGASSGGGAGTSGTGSAGAGTTEVGDPCASASQCPAGGSGTAVCVTDWRAGYCAVSACAAHGHDCPTDPGLGGTAKTGSKCVLAPTAMCLALCASSADCRDEYECVAKPDAAGHATANVCFPKQSSSGTGGMGGGMGSGGGPNTGGGGGMGTGGGMSMDGGSM